MIADERARRHRPPLVPSVLATVLLFSWLAGASSLSAQLFQGTVVEAGSGAPVSGAMIVAEDDVGAMVARTLTDAEGRFRLRPTEEADVRAVRVDRIGYRSQSFDADALAADGTGILRVDAEPIEIRGIDVAGESLCAGEGQDGGSVHRLWNEARKSLTVIELSRGIRVSAFHLQRWERTLDPNDGAVRSERIDGRIANPLKPYRSLSLEQMTRTGWVEESPTGELHYYAPDAAVLLSREFSEQHCFTAEESEDEILLRFRPNRTREGIPEIEGVMVLDPATAELTELRFGYVELPLPSMAEAHAGGEVHFYGAPNGIRVVREWSIRMPVLRVVLRRALGAVNESVRVEEVREEGGRIVRVMLDGEVLEIPTVGP